MQSAADGESHLFLCPLKAIYRQCGFFATPRGLGLDQPAIMAPPQRVFPRTVTRQWQKRVDCCGCQRRGYRTPAAATGRPSFVADPRRNATWVRRSCAASLVYCERFCRDPHAYRRTRSLARHTQARFKTAGIVNVSGSVIVRVYVRRFPSAAGVNRSSSRDARPSRNRNCKCEPRDGNNIPDAASLGTDSTL
jgi:hypothetical protein